MLKLPKTRKQWIVASIGAFSGFFFGGAMMAATQVFFHKAFGWKI